MEKESAWREIRCRCDIEIECIIDKQIQRDAIAADIESIAAKVYEIMTLKFAVQIEFSAIGDSIPKMGCVVMSLAGHTMQNCGCCEYLAVDVCEITAGDIEHYGDDYSLST